MTTWVLLRGLMRDSRHWDDFPARLGAVVGDAELIALDLPGNGTLNHLTSPSRVEAMAEWCRAELAGRGLRPPYGVVAMSLGAMVTACWALRHPEDLAGCVLINTSLRPSPFYRRLRPRNYLRFLPLLLSGADERRWERAVFDATSNRPEIAADILPAWIAWHRQLPVSRANALRQLLAAWRYGPTRQRPAPPVLLLASSRDALVNVRCSRNLASRWGLRLIEHPTAGHDLPLDDPQWLAERIGDWLAGE